MHAHLFDSLQWTYKHMMKKMFKMLHFFFFFSTAKHIFAVVYPWAFLYIPSTGQPSQCRWRHEGKSAFFVYLFVCLSAFAIVSLLWVPCCLASQLWQVVRGEIMNTVVMWPWPHISHNSSEAVKWNIKTGSGEWLSAFTALSWA